MDADGRRNAIQIVVGFGSRSLFGLAMANGGIPAWNALMSDLFDRELLFPYWTPAQRPPPLIVMIDLSRMNLSHKRLDRINLAFCWAQDADFTGSSLRDARMPCGRGNCYRGCRLDRADFRQAEISGCDFTGCTGLDTALFDGAVFDPSNSPVGLPPEVLAKCRAESDLPRSAGGESEAHVQCCATLHVIPTEAP